MNDALKTPSEITDPRLATLRARLALPLPGRAAHARYEPELAFGRHAGPVPRSARAAAVVLLIYEHDGKWCVPLTVRPAHLANHAGQVSLPGGVVEAEETSSTAALRELEEELGIVAATVKLLGTLSPLYLYVTNFIISPHVAAVAKRPDFRPNAAEVAEVVEIPLSRFGLDEPVERAVRRFRALEFYAPAVRVDDHEVWGATAMILAELAEVFAPTSARPWRALR
jgi:8-oxo-dGTP pyrophosphatase MutT (NUDIX family)